MKKLVIALSALLLLGTTAVPANAQFHRHHFGSGAAFATGALVGFGLGAPLAFGAYPYGYGYGYPYGGYYRAGYYGGYDCPVVRVWRHGRWHFVRDCY